MPKEKDRRQNTNTTHGWEEDTWKKIYNQRQWLKRFKQNTKSEHEIYIGPLIKEGTITGTKWNTEEEKVNKIFFGHWDPKQHTI